MRRFFVLSMATALLGGCSCKGTPGQSSTPGQSPTPLDAGHVQRPQTPPPQVAPPPPEPPREPPIPEGAMKAHSQGRASGEVGNFQEALKHFQQARELAPAWPLPVYDMAYTYVLMKDNAKALPLYEEVDKLAPQGFSDVKRVIECLRREKAGRVPKGTYRKFIDVTNLRVPEEREKQLGELTRTAPGFYPAWHEFTAYGKDLDEQERRLEKALALEPDLWTRGELLLQRALLLRRRGKDAEARALLQSLVDDPRSLPATVTEARELLSIHLPP